MAFLVHRWLGIALALLMAVWTLSGIVMMYVSYPETTAAERAAGLDALDLSQCCAAAGLPEGPLERVSVEMLLGQPVLRVMTEAGPVTLGLRDGAPLAVGENEARQVAATHYRNTTGHDAAVAIEPVDVDQWTLQLRRYAPLYKASMGDAAGSELYVSGLTGEIVQDTTRRERFWNWLGAVPHWLYFTALRKDGALWSEVVIYASQLGTCLTLTGIYIGLRMFRRGPRWTPLRGIAMWHHWTGLVFGLVTLTWVFSGFASMQPWGWLEGEGAGQEIEAMAGRAIEPRDVVDFAAALAAHPQSGVVSAELAMQQGRPWAIVAGRDGARIRASLPNLADAAPDDAGLAALSRAARPGAEPVSQGLITEGDAYHYSHHSTPAVLPAWRAIWADAGAPRLYLDPRTGEPVGFVDAGSRGFRWWHSALHRLDFAPLRDRPLWDAVMLALLAGVAVLSLLGVWMGIRRLRRNERV
ncbi:PepSY domain-containing protein [Croceibacterium salegens]|nr:PepSY domain-containing protein [Croceibacterium salegens]